MAIGPSSGARAALLDQPAGVAHGLARLVAGARGLASGAVGVVARGVGGGDRLRGLLRLGERGALGAGGALGVADQLVAAVALGQQPVLAARGHLAQLAGGRRPHAAGAGHRDAVEVGADALEALDDPDVGEQAARQ